MPAVAATSCLLPGSSGRRSSPRHRPRAGTGKLRSLLFRLSHLQLVKVHLLLAVGDEKRRLKWPCCFRVSPDQVTNLRIHCLVDLVKRLSISHFREVLHESLDRRRNEIMAIRPWGVGTATVAVFLIPWFQKGKLLGGSRELIQLKEPDVFYAPSARRACEECAARKASD